MASGSVSLSDGTNTTTVVFTASSTNLEAGFRLAANHKGYDGALRNNSETDPISVITAWLANQIAEQLETDSRQADKQKQVLAARDTVRSAPSRFFV